LITVRISFEKKNEASYISLLDLQRVMQRVLKRSGLPVYYTQGFNPHIYLSFACPLSLGQESLCECCEVKTEAEDPQLDTWCDVLQPYMPRGIKVLSAQQAQNKVAEIDHASYLVTLPASAAAALDTIKDAINYVSNVRGTLGATQNRLDHTINNLSVMQENIQDAESTIRDTDVADEMMAYTKNNILIQSAQAMLAQANQVPQGVLQLLQ